MNQMRTLGLAAGLALLGCVQTAAAADDVGKWYVAPMGYEVYTGNPRAVDDHPAFGFAVGKNTSDKWSVELAFNRGTFRARNAADDLTINALSLDVLRHYYRDAKIHPYLTFGVVQSSETRDSIGNYTRQMVEGGLGLMSRLYTSPDRSSVLHLRAEAKGRWHVSWLTDPHQGEPADFLAGLGFQFNWGAPAPVAAAPVAAPVDVDSDGDGVVDRLDQCPGTPAGAKVDANGCELDSDGDGVVDRLDRCPGTPAGAKVDANGCELDSDGDGVVDRLDQCPGTPHGTKVDARGCEIEAIVLRGVNFDFDSSHLTAASEKVLDEVVALLKLRAGSVAVIGGHTDGRGKKAYNQKLSERRATAVVEYLVAHGVPAAALRAKGYGATQPIASNDTEDGRAQNRRVTLEFTTNVTK